MFSLPNGKMTIAQVLFPLSLIAFVLFLMLAFQTTEIVRDREAMHQASTQQDKPLDEAKRVQSQLSALAIGTKKLADKGDKNAKNIIDRMKKLGITISDNPPSGAGSPMPGAPQGSPPGAPAGGMQGMNMAPPSAPPPADR